MFGLCCDLQVGGRLRGQSSPRHSQARPGHGHPRRRPALREYLPGRPSRVPAQPLPSSARWASWSGTTSLAPSPAAALTASAGRKPSTSSPCSLHQTPRTMGVSPWTQVRIMRRGIRTWWGHIGSGAVCGIGTRWPQGLSSLRCTESDGDGVDDVLDGDAFCRCRGEGGAAHFRSRAGSVLVQAACSPRSRRW